jgi:hypothetical protein
MKRRLHISMVGLALAMVLLACMAVAGTAAAQTGQDTDPVAVVKAFNAAINRNDLTGARALLDPAFRKLVGPDSANAQEESKDQFPPVPLPHVQEANVHQIDANTVEMDITLSGGALPPLPHPFSLHVTYTVKNGLIIQILDRLSPQTVQDLAALAPPASAPAELPKTGESDPRAVTVLLVLGIVCALAGAAIRRAWVLHL